MMAVLLSIFMLLNFSTSFSFRFIGVCFLRSLQSPMATYIDAGTIKKTVLKKTYEEAHIEWRISDFLSIAETKVPWTNYYSPAFIVYDVSWFLRIFPKPSTKDGFIRLYLCSYAVKREYCIEYDFSLKNSNGRVQQLVSGILERNEKETNAQNLITFSELFQRKSEFAPQNVLTIICRLKRETGNSIQTNALDKTVPMELIRLDKLSENFKDLFGDKESCDVTFKVKDKEYKAHRSVLIARSSVFAATFKHDTLERQTGVITISNCDPDSFQKFLEYLYSGKLKELCPHTAINLYYTSNKYDVEELKAFCVEYLMHSLTVETVCEMAIFMSMYDEVQLFSVVQDFFNKNFLQIFLTSEWKHLMENHCHLGNKLLKEMAQMKLEK